MTETYLGRLSEGDRLRLRAEKLLRDIGYSPYSRVRERYEAFWRMHDLDWQALQLLPIAFATAGVVDVIGVRFFGLPVICSPTVEELELVIRPGSR